MRWLMEVRVGAAPPGDDPRVQQFFQPYTLFLVGVVQPPDRARLTLLSILSAPQAFHPFNGRRGLTWMRRGPDWFEYDPQSLQHPWQERKLDAARRFDLRDLFRAVEPTSPAPHAAGWWALPGLLEVPPEQTSETLAGRRVTCSTWRFDPPVPLLYFHPVERLQRWFDPAQNRCLQEAGWAATGERIFLTEYDDFEDGPAGTPVPLRAETTVDPVEVPAFGRRPDGGEVEGRLPMAGRRLLEFFQILPPGVVVLREFQVYHENGTLLCQTLCHDYIIDGGVAPDEFDPGIDPP